MGDVLLTKLLLTRSTSSETLEGLETGGAKGLDPGWPLAGKTFKICVRAGVRLCSALCSKMSAVLEGQRCWSICEYLGPESEC